LAGDRIKDVDEITNLPLISCLNHLAYLFDLNKEKEKIAKRAQNQRRL